jgi:signal transduction histidine kinase
LQGIAPSEPMRGAAAGPDDGAALAELVADGVLETEAGEVVRANAQAAALLGAGSDAAALVGRELAELLAPRGEGPLVRDESESVPCRVLGVPGECHVNLRTRTLERGRALHVVIDMQEHERANTALLETARDLQLARREAATLRRAFREAVAERRELVNVVCHELRTPITVIRGYARLLLSEATGPLTDEQRRFVQEAAKSCGRLDDFVELLLRATNEERAAMDDLVEIEASLAPVLEGAVDYLRPVLEERGVRVELLLDPGALWARFDAARVEQVVANLLNNGLEYAGGGGVLRIHTRAVPSQADDEPDWIEVGVSDDGPGVPEADRARIFEPYVRGLRAPSERGLGLGLSICRRIVEAHGGRIEVRCAADCAAAVPGLADAKGSCFAFLLPAANPESSRAQPAGEG